MSTTSEFNVYINDTLDTQNAEAQQFIDKVKQHLDDVIEYNNFDSIDYGYFGINLSTDGNHPFILAAKRKKPEFKELIEYCREKGVRLYILDEPNPLSTIKTKRLFYIGFMPNNKKINEHKVTGGGRTGKFVYKDNGISWEKVFIATMAVSMFTLQFYI